MLFCDFNMTVENKNLEVFMNSFGLECLIKKPTCFQSKNPSCIDLILTDKNDLFKNSNVLEVGISDHNSLIITLALISSIYCKYELWFFMPN